MILCKVVRFIVPWKPLNSGRARVILSMGGDEQNYAASGMGFLS